MLGTTTGRGASLVTVTYTVVAWHSAGALGEAAGAETAGADAAGAEGAGAEGAGADAEAHGLDS